MARLLDVVRIQQEPRGLLGRFLLKAEADFEDFGLVASFAPIARLPEVVLANEPTWNGLTPILDARIEPIGAEVSRCLFISDRKGNVVSACATRLVDLGTRTVAEAARDLTLFYGDAAPKWRGRHRCEITSPTAETVRGPVMYHGAFWVRPDHRHSGLGVLVRHTSRYAAVAAWDFTHEVSVGASAFSNDALARRYAYTINEPTVSFFADGEPLMENGLFVAAPRPQLLLNLARLVEASQVDASQADAVDVADRDEKRVASR